MFANRFVVRCGLTARGFQRRRPSCFTHVIVRSRAGDRGPWPEAFAILADPRLPFS